MKTKVKIKVYKLGGKFEQLIEGTVDDQPWETEKILETVYRLYPPLTDRNFTMDVEQGDYFNGRLVLNGI